MKKHKYNLSYTHLTSCDMGELIPLGCKSVNQGDVWNMSTNVLCRFSPLLAPVMHPTHMVIHHWFVPLRIIWDQSGGANTGFEAFITGGPSGTSNPTYPTITMPNSGVGGVAVGSLANYLGVPFGYNADNSGYSVSALPFRAYADIWNNFYRDEDLQSSLVIDRSDGLDTTTNTALQNVCWEKDYYTSARPSPQKGTAVTIPLSGQAPVATAANTGSANPLSIRNSTLSGYFGIGADQPLAYRDAAAGVAGNLLYTDLSVSGANINISDLRLSSSTQRFMERMSRAGSRMYEWLRSQGIRHSDSRLQLPEYLGGGRQTIQYSEVLQTAEGTDPVGDLKGHGIGAARSNRFVRFFEEPGLILTLGYVLPKTIYTQGLDRAVFNRRTKFDYFQPEMQYIGQQQVLNKEVYAAHTTPNGVFGYQDRYDEDRRSESRVSGEFLSTLNYWHFGRSFASSPTLNGDFVKAVPTENPFAVPSADVLYFMVNHRIAARRLLTNNPKPRLL